MRIIHLISSLASGGAETLARNLSLDLVGRGHDCHIVYVSDAESFGASVSYEAVFKTQLDQGGVTYEVIGHDCRRNIVKGASKLRSVVRSYRPDVLHIHLGYGLLFQAVGLLRVPTVYTHHNIRLKFSRHLFKVFDYFVNAYVAICGPCEALLRRCSRRPIALIYNGVPDDFSASRPLRKRRGSGNAVLSVGNLTAQKDYATLIDAAAIVAARMPDHDVRFSIAGEGSQREELRDRISSQAAGLVDLLGARSDVPALMAGADLLVMSSLYEGLPISLIEAAKCGLPMVATDVGGCNEVVRDGVNGRLVNPGDHLELAEAIVAILQDDTLRSSYSQASIEIARDFSMTICADKHLQLYKNLSNL